MEEQSVRVRFAPSPTGPLHIGGVRTALYNYLFARRHGGVFILRIEDTDQNRYVPGAEEYIIESLKWCGIEYDEGIHMNGPHAPYRQSERREIYGRYALELVKKGFAYYAFDTPDELEELRGELGSSGSDNTSYSALVRMKMKNSLTLSSEEVRRHLESGTPYVVRFKMPVDTLVEVDDMIRGSVVVNSSTLDDKVLFKSDGMPTYHLANIVDDHLMEVTHVIRGEEWLPSLPLHALLYRAFGWDMPVFAHLPLLLRPDGKGKLSKRDGDRLGFPVFPLEWKNPQTGEVYPGFRESGYFPEAFINMMVLLGWNPGTEQEIFSLDELVASFSLERVVKSGSRFDPEKARSFNQHYLRQKSDDQILDLFLPMLGAMDIKTDRKYAGRVLGLIKERAVFVKDLPAESHFFFRTPAEYDPESVGKRWNDHSPALMQQLRAVLKEVDDFNAENAEAAVKTWISEQQLPMGQVMNAFRICIVGELKGPGLFQIADLIGKKETLHRIDLAIAKLTPGNSQTL